MSLLVIPAHDVDITGQPVAADLPESWIDEQIGDTGGKARAPGRIEGRISRSGKADIVVRAKVQADVSMPCARCLEPTSFPVKADLSLMLRPRPPAPPVKKLADKKGAVDKKGVGAKPSTHKPSTHKQREYEFSADEADTDEYDGEEVVLDPFIREAILLELPSFPLCSESCPGFGANTPHAMGRGGERGPFAVEPSDLEQSAPGRRTLRGQLLHLGGELGKVATPKRETASPSALRRAARATSRKRPKIQTSMKGRNKKS